MCDRIIHISSMYGHARYKIVVMTSRLIYNLPRTNLPFYAVAVMARALVPNNLEVIGRNHNWSTTTFTRNGK